MPFTFLRNWFQDRAQVFQGWKRVPILASQRSSFSLGGEGTLTSHSTPMPPCWGVASDEPGRVSTPGGGGGGGGGPSVPGGVIDNAQGDEMNFKK